MDTPPPTSSTIIVIGDACLDRYHYGFCERLSPEAPVLVVRHNHTDECEGMSLNVANNLMAFGENPYRVYNEEIIRKERFVDLRTNQHLLRADFGESQPVKPLSSTRIRSIPFDRASAVIISDYNKGFITPKVARAIAKECATRDIPFFVDSKKHDLRCFEGAIIKINRRESEAITHYPTSYDLIVTLGPAGAEWQKKVYPTAECEVFDVSGAGDTFLAACVYEYLRTANMEKAILFANKCSRVVVQKSGTYCLRKEDIS
jgi:D-beta-D-heptose 7-phosphate kinase/D-beta-D-heptose 1-phosphate adenosyltransferase